MVLSRCRAENTPGTLSNYKTKKKTKEWEGVAKPTYSPDTEPKIHHLHSNKLTLYVKNGGGGFNYFF